MFVLNYTWTFILCWTTAPDNSRAYFRELVDVISQNICFPLLDGSTVIGISHIVLQHPTSYITLDVQAPDNYCPQVRWGRNIQYAANECVKYLIYLRQLFTDDQTAKALYESADESIQRQCSMRSIVRYGSPPSLKIHYCIGNTCACYQ